LRVLLVTVEEPFYIPIFLSNFLQNFHEDLIGVVVIPPYPINISFFKYVTIHLNMYGVWVFSIQSFRYVYRLFLDFIYIYFRIGKPHSVKSLLTKNKIPIFTPKNINNKDFINLMKDFNLDLIISVASIQIFKKRLLSLPRLGCINVHGSLLPKHKGLNPSFWVLLEDEKETGVTVHFMKKSIDTGKIIIQHAIQISDKESLDSLNKKIAKEGSNAVLEAISLLSKGISKNSLSSQPNGGSYHSFPTKEDGIEFRKKGLKFL